MNPRPKQNTIEWFFLALLVFLSGGLTVWQYRGTGEVARAEMMQMQSNLHAQAKLLCHAFDAELAKSCALLLPKGSDLEKRDWKEVQAELLKKWIAQNPRPLFSRVAVTVRRGSEVQLFGLDFKTGEIKEMQRPPEWLDMPLNPGPHDKKGGGPSARHPDDFSAAPLPFDFDFPHEPMLMHGGPPPGLMPFNGPSPFSNSTGTVFQIPVFGNAPSESEWLIFELDVAYVRETWLPQLIAWYINPKGPQFNDVTVKTAAPLGAVIYSSQSGHDNSRSAPISVAFNQQGRDDNLLRAQGCWVLEVQPHSATLEASISASRLRNFAGAVALNAFLLAVGCLLIHHTRRARRLAEEQMNFVANVSHELYTPLTVIRGAAHNLQRGVVREPSRIEQYAGLIIQHAEQLTEMVEQVLAVAGMRNSLSNVPYLPVCLTEILHAAVPGAQHEIQANHCKLQLDLAPTLPAVSGDQAALRRVFQNLITNAAKHGGDGGWIGVRAETIDGSAPSMIEVQVSDLGAGIPKSEQSEIFKPFFRGTAAQTRQIRGSGLGLSLVREIVEAHGGTISVTSEAGCGTTFTVRLPAATPKN